ncbi:DUF4133 domain-containing protein [Chryseobacterium potabilaquae]|uniref:DUF4133 domain-containing protein n=1 Tax=Chryseobacterium potabilaquae TaxID=2675057 RepID=A0A6N4XB84_9FLAO|nr:DUF4133 domain-containing protein [Chryseobacterium potabilaquae]CAA7197002.1 hypothetical protein CHRY9293_03060 [Chryseobacterium potabilaquae]
MGYYLYKGLKKPLVFFGLKDKYIYQAVGTVVGGFISAAILSSFLGIFGSILGLGLGGLVIGGIYKKQDKKGLYNKTKNHRELHIFPKKFKIKISHLKNKNK